MCALCYRFIFEYAKERCLGRHLANKLLTREGGGIRIRGWEAEVGIWGWVGYGGYTMQPETDGKEPKIKITYLTINWSGSLLKFFKSSRNEI